MNRFNYEEFELTGHTEVKIGEAHIFNELVELLYWLNARFRKDLKVINTSFSLRKCAIVSASRLVGLLLCCWFFRTR